MSLVFEKIASAIISVWQAHGVGYVPKIKNLKLKVSNEDSLSIFAVKDIEMKFKYKDQELTIKPFEKVILNDTVFELIPDDEYDDWMQKLKSKSEYIPIDAILHGFSLSVQENGKINSHPLIGLMYLMQLFSCKREANGIEIRATDAVINVPKMVQSWLNTFRLRPVKSFIFPTTCALSFAYNHSKFSIQECDFKPNGIYKLTEDTADVFIGSEKIASIKFYRINSAKPGVFQNRKISSAAVLDNTHRIMIDQTDFIWITIPEIAVAVKYQLCPNDGSMIHCINGKNGIPARNAMIKI